jgi:hypothetical protein
MAFGDADIAFMMSDVLGVDVRFRGKCTRGFLDAGDGVANDNFGGPVQSSRKSVTIKTGSIPGLDVGDEGKVDGEDVVVRLVSPADDGKLMVLHLAEA